MIQKRSPDELELTLLSSNHPADQSRLIKTHKSRSSAHRGSSHSQNPLQDWSQASQLQTSLAKAIEQERIETIHLRNLKVFPIFGDKSLRSRNINYFLYLELYSCCIRIILWQVLLLPVVYIVANQILQLVLNFDAQDPQLEHKDKEAFSLIVFGWSSIVNGTILIFLVRHEEKRVIKLLYDGLELSENLFSLEVKVKKRRQGSELEEFTTILDALLSKSGVSDEVEYVTILQDLYQWNKIEQGIIRAEEKLLNKESEKADKLLVKKEDLIAELLREYSRVRNHERFRGKAIVVFSTIEAKLTFASFLRHKQKSLVAKEIVEPEDFVFAKVHYPKRQRRRRKILSIAGGLVICAFALVLVLPQVADPISEVGDILEAAIFGILPWNLLAAVDLSSIISAIIIGIFRFILKAIYKLVAGQIIYSNTSSFPIHQLNYLIITSFWLYIIVPFLLALMNYSNLSMHPITLSIGYWVTSLVKKFLHWAAYMCVSKSPIQRSRRKLLRFCAWIQDKIKASFTRFDLVDGVSNVFVLIVLHFAYLTPNVSITDPNSLVLLKFGFPLLSALFIYFFAIIAKHRIIRYSIPFKLKSADFALKAAFRVLQFDCLPFFTGGVILIITRYNLNGPKLLDHWIYYTALALNFVCGVLFLFFDVKIKCGKRWQCLRRSLSLYQKVRKKIYKRHRKTLYADIWRDFPSRYVDKDPVLKVPQNDN